VADGVGYACTGGSLPDQTGRIAGLNGATGARLRESAAVTGTAGVLLVDDGVVCGDDFTDPVWTAVRRCGRDRGTSWEYRLAAGVEVAAVCGSVEVAAVCGSVVYAGDSAGTVYALQT